MIGDNLLLFLKNLFFTVLVPGTVAIYVPVGVFSHGTVEFGLRAGGASLLLVAGASIYFWCLWEFASFGRGTPALIDPPRRLVVRGLYRYTRNPMYLGVLTVILGWALLFWSDAIAFYACGVCLCFHAFVMLIEEPYLKITFGEDYDKYCKDVGRWLSLSTTTGSND